MPRDVSEGGLRSEDSPASGGSAQSWGHCPAASVGRECCGHLSRLPWVHMWPYPSLQFSHPPWPWPCVVRKTASALVGEGVAGHTLPVFHSPSLQTCFCILPGCPGLAALLVSFPRIWYCLKLSPLHSYEQGRGGVEQMAMWPQRLAGTQGGVGAKRRVREWTRQASGC